MQNLTLFIVASILMFISTNIVYRTIAWIAIALSILLLIIDRA